MPRPEHHVIVCTNRRPPDSPKGSCGEKGADEVLQRLKAQVREMGLDGRVMVTRGGCLKHCSQGVTVAVQPDNTWYARLTPDDVEPLCREHLVEGRPLAGREMPDIPWE